MKNKLLILILFIILTTFLTFAEELIDKYFNEAKSSYILKDYEKAYSRLKFVLKYYNYNEYDIPQDVKSLAENIYYEYIKKLYYDKNNEALNNIYYSDPYYSTAEKNSVKIKEFKKQIEEEKSKRQQEEEIAKKVEEEKKKYEEELRKKEELLKIQKEQEAEFEKLKKEKEEAYNKELAQIKKEQEELLNLKKEEDKIKDIKMQQLLNKQIEESQLKQERLEKLREAEKKELLDMQNKIFYDRIEAEKKMKDEMAAYFDKFLLSKEKESKTIFSSIVLIILLLIAVFVIVFALIFSIIIIFMKNSHRQQQRYFEYSMKLLQNQPLQNSTNVLSFPLVSPSIDTDHLLEDVNIKKLAGPAAIPDQNMEKLKKIIETCSTYSIEIDHVTHRKNCAKNVADLVYKISKIMGYNEYDSLVFFAVSLIYDIGFLNIDPNILSKPDINEDEFEVIKTHTTHGLNLIHFIDNDVKPVFIDGISKHHENLDGSGYPAGLKQNEVPYIARVIRIVETFISLISVRKYKKITDKESAIQMLSENKKVYDLKIVNVLNNII